MLWGILILLRKVKETEKDCTFLTEYRSWAMGCPNFCLFQDVGRVVVKAVLRDAVHLFS